MKRVTLLVFICLALAATVSACHLVAPTPDPAEIQRLVAEAVRATIEAMPTATPYPTYTPVLLASTPTPNPTHAVGSTATAVSATPESQLGSAFRTHIVVAGDTLSGLAREYGTTVEAIMEANNLSDPSLIVVGQVLSIPVGEAGPTSTPLNPTATPRPPTATPTETPAP